GKFLGTPTNDGAEVFLLESAAKPKTVETCLNAGEISVHSGQIAAGFAAKILILGTLDDTVEGLIGVVGSCGGKFGVFIEAALCPAAGTFQCLHLVTARVVQGGELVKGHHDIGA